MNTFLLAFIFACHISLVLPFSKFHLYMTKASLFKPREFGNFLLTVETDHNIINWEKNAGKHLSSLILPAHTVCLQGADSHVWGPGVTIVSESELMTLPNKEVKSQKVHLPRYKFHSLIYIFIVKTNIHHMVYHQQTYTTFKKLI